jgi:hypothetical protein
MDRQGLRMRIVWWWVVLSWLVYIGSPSLAVLPDANFLTFHRIAGFRTRTMTDSVEISLPPGKE